jgi:hypothetical protein
MIKVGLVVIPEYQAPYGLPSWVGDISNWKRTLMPRFPLWDRGTYGSRATRSNILIQLNGIVNSVRSANVRPIIVFCGHGSRLVDSSGDESDGYDECIVSSDIQPIFDDEIGRILSRLPEGVIADIVLDCCYSGTGTQMVSPKYNGPVVIELPLIDSFPISKQFNGILTKLPKIGTLSHVENHRLWAACGENQLAYSVISDGQYYGLFSLFLCWGLRNLSMLTAEQLMAWVRQQVTAIVPGQVPQLEGIGLDQVPF